MTITPQQGAPLHTTRSTTGRQKAAAVATITVVGGALVVNGTPAEAVGFEVTNLDPSGPGSLAQAIEDANVSAGLDEITFANGLTGTIDLDAGLVVNDATSIVGPGPEVITLARADGGILYVYGAESLTVTGLSLEPTDRRSLDINAVGAVVIDDVVITGGDDGVEVDGAEAVTITNSTISGVRGDSIDIDQTAGPVVLSDLDIASGDDSLYFYGRSIRVDDTYGNVSVERVTANSAVDLQDTRADAIALGDVDVSDLAIESATPYGARLRTSGNEGTTTVAGVTVSGDGFASAGFSGRSYYAGPMMVTNTGTAVISDVTVSSGDGAGAMYMRGFTDVEVSGVDVAGSFSARSIDRGTVSDSSFVDGNGRSSRIRRAADKVPAELYLESDEFRRDGTALAFYNSAVELEQVTVSGHTTGTTMILRDSEVSMAHSTIGGNTLSGPSLFLTGTSSTIALDHTILSDAPADGSDFVEAREDDGGIILMAPVDSDRLTFTADHSLVPVGVATDYDLADSNIETDDPRLGPVQDNSGPLPTAAPLPGSPAIDGGDPAITDAPAFDQRGQQRIVDVIDIGAVETTALLESIDPARFVDTREGRSTFDGRYAGEGKRQTGSTYTVDIAGRGDVPDGATAVVMNVTAVAPEGGGFLTVFACDDDQPNASSLNFNGSNVGNEVIAGLAEDGTICLFIQGTAHLTVDVVAYATEQSAITPVTPARSFESRVDKTTADGRFQGTGRLAAGSQATVPIAGRNGVPADAEVVIVNITAIRPDAAGFMTVHPCLPTRPNASSVNFEAGTVRANEIVAQLNEFGELCVYTSAATDLAIDVTGYLPAGAIEAVPPARLLDTRPTGTTTDGQQQRSGQAAGGSTTTLPVINRAGVPADAKAVVVNVTAIRPTERGFVTVSACVTPPPTASSLNYEAGVNTPNEIIAGVDENGAICLFTSAATDLAVDVVAFIR